MMISVENPEEEFQESGYLSKIESTCDMCSVSKGGAYSPEKMSQFSNSESPYKFEQSPAKNETLCNIEEIGSSFHKKMDIIDIKDIKLNRIKQTEESNDISSTITSKDSHAIELKNVFKKPRRKKTE